ncbi:uncharacterized protein LY89DRAFT_688623 [Mollisia scopiformis]|uniref:Uncharacterized protein n=1 Tax=Mollisia scopiformis TaxID=149040 RepID=A0A194WX49_MOLSC|nr:uncharacterized protein LY89DRAFT_688623 [Mollisia scopiformis]KUJ12162.1 hypothetical protein LY89DRAFT_688623 [Mollisia scopiformis]
MAAESDILDELYAALDGDPKSVYLHERLLEVWAELGDKDMTTGFATTLQRLDPKNEIAAQYLGQKSKSKTKHVSNQPNPKTSKASRPWTHPDFAESSNSQPIKNLSAQEKDLSDGYTILKLEAQMLQVELAAVLSHLSTSDSDDQEVLPTLQAISEGRVGSVVPMEQPMSVRSRAREIAESPSEASSLIIEDFEAIIRWAACQDPPLLPDAIRERLVKRKTLLEAAIPDSMTKDTTAALRHIERAYLEKTYVNSETMLGDDISEIPKENFFVSEDNYAWDMDELAQAITANDGVMRNPLSKQLFTESDIKQILAHPLGQRLKPMQLKQSQLKKGIRPSTIQWVSKVGKIMLEDQSVDIAPSRKVMDEFLAYVATLPKAEQETIKSLKIPGVDSTSKQPFDYTIGESIRDAVANTTCLHKVGDFLSQAAVYLKKQ